MSATINKSSHVKQRKHDKKIKTAKIKKKEYWIKVPKKQGQAKPEQKVNQMLLPPSDTQQFSANWKTLQEMLNKQPKKPQRQNGAIPKGKSIKPSSIPYKVQRKAKDSVKEPTASKDTNTKDSTSDATKRKKDVKDKHRQDVKKQKTEEKANKPTEKDIWFDDVDPDDLEATVGAEAAEIMRKKMGIQQSKDVESALVKERGFEGLTKAVAIDCEMVGVGPDGEESILARVSLVNRLGKCIYDKYVKPTEKVTDYRTHVSGIRPEDIQDGEDIDTVRREVAEILRDRIVVGHAIHNDLKLLLLDHPKKKIRDTQKYEGFKKIAGSKRPALRVLCREVLNVRVQQGEHSSVQDAQATMRLYTSVKKQWEADIKAKDSEKKQKRKPKQGKSQTVRTGFSA